MKRKNHEVTGCLIGVRVNRTFRVLRPSSPAKGGYIEHPHHSLFTTHSPSPPHVAPYSETLPRCTFTIFKGSS
ncbi:hypothetical protein E2C01_050207 [Portunus trituberculatus]|uniref:Uncharacterized protein n=1 Tax=Portunus trituberculatus TaxID=210409 RepID=A0A5B7GIA4_PORTR|nr:hypothetical protein [Portunus trituberculatus]